MAGGIDDGVYTYDLPPADGGARRPNLRDLGGDEVVNDDPAPKKYEQICAEWVNNTTRTLAGLARITGTVKVWVQFVSGQPVVVKVSAMGTLLDTNSIVPTLVSTGEIALTWTALVLPAMEADPIPWLNSGPGTIYARRDNVNENKVLVFTTNPAGVGTNLNFGVEIG